MADPTTLGRVFYSSEAGRFYQEGRRGALPTLEAFAHLHVAAVGRGVGLRDELNQAVPPLYSLIPGRFQIHTFATQRDVSLASRDVYTQRAPKSSYYTTLATWVDDQGRLHVTLRNFKGGAAINPELEKSKLAAAIAKDLGLGPGARGTDAILELVQTTFHYVAR